MILVGSGGPMSKALRLTLNLGHSIEFGVTNSRDTSTDSFKRFGIKIIESSDINNTLLEMLTLEPYKEKRQTVILVNNKTIITDKTLETNADFYNFHFGLTQKYRGIAEICIISAILNDEQEYGVTLHKILPREKVDKGPILGQKLFPLSNQSTFATILDSCMQSLLTLYSEMIPSVIDGEYSAINNIWNSDALSIRNLDTMFQNSRPDQIQRILEFGPYLGFLSDFHCLIQKKVVHSHLH